MAIFCLGFLLFKVFFYYYLFIGGIFSLDTSSVKENKKRKCVFKQINIKKAFFLFFLNVFEFSFSLLLHYTYECSALL